MKDKHLTKEMMKVLYSSSNVNKKQFLIVSKYIERTRVNLILLRFLLKDMKLRGMLITIDRPHQYISYLLDLQKIPQSNLIYLDMISRLSCNKSKKEYINVCFTDGPYEIGFLNNLFENSVWTPPVVESLSKRYLDLKELDFIMIDDIAALLKYMDNDGVEEFIREYSSSIRRLKTVISPMVIDANKHRQLFPLLKEDSEGIILINVAKGIIKDISDDYYGTVKTQYNSNLNTLYAKEINI